MAERIGNELLDPVAILQRFPKAGSIYAANRKWRKLVSRPYVIFYRIKPDSHVVEILASWQSAQQNL